MANDITLKSKSGVAKYPKTYSRNILDKDTTPTSGSTNLVTSGGVYSSIAGKQDTLTAGTNITISGSTISATDTTYESKSASSGGTDVSLVTTGEKYTWNSKQDALPTTSTAGKLLTSTSTAGTVQWADAPETGVTDSQINGTSIVTSGVSNFVTNTAYNASTNKIATMSDLPEGEVNVTLTSTSISDGTTTMTLPTIDQTYSASSTNAQSGVAVASAISGKQDALPTVVNDRYLHTNSSTGTLEWSTVSAGVTGVKGDSESTYRTGNVNLELGNFGVTSTASELNILDGATITTEELNTLDGVTASTLTASDIPSLDASKITSGTFADTRIASASTWNGKSTVSVSSTGTATDEVSYITIDGIEKKLAGGSGTLTSITAGTGLTGGTITTSGTIALDASGVTAGTYQGLTVDTYGRVTAASNMGYGTITGITMNGSSKGTTGVVDLGTVITDISGKQDSLSSTQLAACNSGITSSKVTTYDGYSTSKQDAITSSNKLSADLVSNGTSYVMVPAPPDSTNTYTLQCVAGTLTWVQTTWNN